MRLACFVMGVMVIALGCSSAKDVPANAPESWDREIALVDAVDLDPDPHVVEVKLTAKLAQVELQPGVKSEVWTYDGLLPGPRIRAHVGDRVKVHFTNQLPAATSVHWHGVRVPNAMDGNGMTPIPAGGSFDYDFVVPDAGTFWYHPHVDSAAQLGFGLYGSLIVEDPAEPHFGDEATLVLSDIGLDDKGQLTDPHAGGNLGDVFGREGDLLLVNGRSKPTVHARSGAPQRWRLINAAKSRYFQLDLAGHTFVRIGGDGGLREAPIESSTLLVVPGERADVVIVPHGEPGAIVPLRWVPFDRGYGTAFARDPEVLLNLQIDDVASAQAPNVPAHLRTIDPLDLSTAIPDTINLTEQSGDTTSFGIDGTPHDTMLHAKVGSTHRWDVVNQTDWSHPFHLHGFLFRVLDDSGNQLGEWKDTIDVPMRSTRKLAVHFDDRPGSWMFHCHILDHAEIGMMGMLMLDR
ncbi:MAG: multicopper oxidase family protein [Polyangiales bacterium]